MPCKSRICIPARRSVEKFLLCNHKDEKKIYRTARKWLCSFRNNKNCIPFKSKEMKRITFGVAFHCVATNLTVYFTFFGLPSSTDLAEYFCELNIYLRFIVAHTYANICLFACLLGCLPEGLSRFMRKHERDKNNTLKANKTHHISMWPHPGLHTHTYPWLCLYFFFLFGFGFVSPV